MLIHALSGTFRFRYAGSMKTIELDDRTAALLETRDASRGVSVGEMIAELVSFAEPDAAVTGGELAELERQWEAIEAGEPTVPHEKVVRWLGTWGTPDFKPWHEQ